MKLLENIFILIFEIFVFFWILKKEIILKTQIIIIEKVIITFIEVLKISL